MWKSLLSKEVLLSIRDKISLADQTTRSKKALKALPTVSRHVLKVLGHAPYLVFAYLLIAGIDVQYRVLEPPSPQLVGYATFISIILLTAANALCYVEANNQFTTRDRIQKTGYYVTRRILRLVGVIMLSSMITIFGLLMFIIPGIYFALRLSLAAPACLIEDTGIRESMRRSIAATRGQMTLVYTTFSCFGFLLLPAALLLIALPGWYEIMMTFIVFGVYPPVIHTSLGILYLNGADHNTVDILNRK